jgi:hypothetical protein
VTKISIFDIFTINRPSTIWSTFQLPTMPSKIASIITIALTAMASLTNAEINCYDNGSFEVEDVG